MSPVIGGEAVGGLNSSSATSFHGGSQRALQGAIDAASPVGTLYVAVSSGIYIMMRSGECERRGV